MDRLDWGYSACTALNNDGDNPEQAVDAIRATSSLTDTTARTVVKAAATHLCPASSSAASNLAASNLAATPAQPQ